MDELGDKMEGKPRWTTRPVTLHAVQCARCMKWRVVPSKEYYEPIREHILEKPWVCEDAVKWKSDAHCDIPADIEQDHSMLWAIDKPSLPAAPAGWERQITVRTDGSSKFADVYYTSPLGTRLRSKVEIERHISMHPGCVPPDTTMDQFSFAIPRPLPGAPHLNDIGGKFVSPTFHTLPEESNTSEQSTTIQSADNSSSQKGFIVPSAEVKSPVTPNCDVLLNFRPGDPQLVSPNSSKRQQSGSPPPSLKRTKQQIKRDRLGLDAAVSSNSKQQNSSVS